MFGINLKKNLIAIIILLILLFLLIILIPTTDIKSNNSKYHLIINNKELNLIVASTTESKELGLGNRKSLSEDTAMLFTFDRSDKYGIWMKDMNFSIDIFWIDDEGKILTLEENISPETYPRVYTPVGNSSFILETSAGFAKKNNLKVGNFLKLTQK